MVFLCTSSINLYASSIKVVNTRGKVTVNQKEIGSEMIDYGVKLEALVKKALFK